MAAALKHAEAGNNPEALDAWASWALSEAEALDPLNTSLDDLLGPTDAQEPD